MTIRVAINGYGRIGRNILRALYESNYREKIQVIAINDLGELEASAYLTKYDTVHGKFKGEVSTVCNDMIVNGDLIRVVSERDPTVLPWSELAVDVVLECTGHFTSKRKSNGAY